MLTIKINTEEGFMRALLCLADDVRRGIVVSASIHFEPTHVARMSICYAVGQVDESDLPRLPGIMVEVDEECTTAPGKGQR